MCRLSFWNANFFCLDFQFLLLLSSCCSNSSPSSKSSSVISTMTKGTKKVGVTGKYGTRYGASLRKQVKKFEIQQHSRYVCPFCGKASTKRTCVGIWKCRACRRVMAGGAWTLSTAAATSARSTIARLRKTREEMDR